MLLAGIQKKSLDARSPLKACGDWLRGHAPAAESEDFPFFSANYPYKGKPLTKPFSGNRNNLCRFRTKTKVW
jgi:hypothetical protein